MGIRTKRRLITISYHLTVVIVAAIIIQIGIITGWKTLTTGGAFLIWTDAFTFRLIPLSRYLAERLIPDVVCYGCGLSIDLVSHWKCKCAFQGYRERHVFSPCRNCYTTPEWIVCPSCGTSIVV